MAHNIQFRSLEHGGLERLNGVDAALCAHFGEPVDDVKWFANWFNFEALMFASGMDQNDIRAAIEDDDDPDRVAGHLTILNYLTMHYDIITFRSWGFANR